MNKYSDIEIQTAKNLLKQGYKWIVREDFGEVYAYADKPRKNYDKNYSDNTWQCDGDYCLICTINVPIFQNVTCVDKEPVSLERIVHPQILDDDEKKYLSAVIKPFRGNVNNIIKGAFEPSIKGAFEPSQEFISIYYKNGEATFLPCFEAGTMYKGMERHRQYTLEELGL